MKPIRRRWMRSFRLRLALLLVVAVASLLAAYGIAVARKMEQVSSARVETRMRAVAARWAPEALRGFQLVRWPDGDAEIAREIKLASLDENGTWRAHGGAWPENLRAEWQSWVRTDGFGLVSLLPPERPPETASPVLGRRVGVAEPLAPTEVEKFRFQQWSVEGVPWAVLNGRMNNRFFGLAYDLRDERTAAHSLTRAQLAYFLVAMVPLGALAWIFASRAFRPVHDLAGTMREISGKNLGPRLDENTVAAEFEDLIQVFNEMLRRLERSFQQTARFSADAAHELKTPLAVLQGELEEALAGEEAGSPAQRQFSSMLEEVQRLKGITERLLLLARADAGSLLRERLPVELRPLLEEVLEDVEATSPELVFESDLERMATVGDLVLLRQAVFNLLLNAAKYNRPEGWIRVRLFERESRGRRWATLEVENAGDPIPRAAQGQLFERFYRTDEARNRAIPGFGLGLSLSREIARAHGGELVLLRSDGAGTCFRMKLPALGLEAAGA